MMSLVITLVCNTGMLLTVWQHNEKYELVIRQAEKEAEVRIFSKIVSVWIFPVSLYIPECALFVKFLLVFFWSKDGVALCGTLLLEGVPASHAHHRLSLTFRF